MVHEHARLMLAHLDSIAAPAVREAYLYFTHHAASLEGFECRPQDKGQVRDFRYYQGNEQPFAFIVNQESPLWYFRPAGMKHPAANLDALRKVFADVQVNPRGEITVRLTDVEQAKRLLERVFGR